MAEKFRCIAKKKGFDIGSSIFDPKLSMVPLICNFSHIFEIVEKESRAIVKGDIIARKVKSFPLGHHYGIYNSNHSVYHYNTTDGSDTSENAEILETTFHDFRSGCDVWIEEFDGLESLHEDEVVHRANRVLGQRGYNLLLKNCQHFATWCKYNVSFFLQFEKTNTVLRLINHLSESFFPEIFEDFDILKVNSDGFWDVERYGIYYNGMILAPDDSEVLTRMTMQEFAKFGGEQATITFIAARPIRTDKSNMVYRIKKSINTTCTPANSFDFCHWVHTGEKYGFLTTGGFLNIDQEGLSKEDFVDFDIVRVDKGILSTRYAIYYQAKYYTSSPDEVILGFSLNEFLSLDGGERETVKLYEKKSAKVTYKEMESRLMSAILTGCISANTYDFCYWVHTGKKYSVLTTGDFLNL